MVKEGRTIDAKVRAGLQCGTGAGLCQMGTGGERNTFPDAPCLADSAEEEDKAQFKPSDGVPCGLGDGFSGTQAPNCLYQVLEAGMHDHRGARNGKGEVWWEGRGKAVSGLAGKVSGLVAAERDPTGIPWKELRKV